MTKKISKFVLTGGPCAGKTTALNTISNVFTQKGYAVIIVPESATEIITSGVHPWDSSRKSVMDFEYAITAQQISKENLYDKIANNMPFDKVLIIYDRGIMDASAYVSKEDMNELLALFSLNIATVMSRYDAVFHLVTAANGAPEFYTLANNAARSETPEQAVHFDNLTIKAWTGHQHLRVIDNSTDFNSKINRLIAEICSALGEPVPIEDERKFLIEYPDLELLSKEVNVTCLSIVQTYLNSTDMAVERRIRQRGIDNDFTYYYTKKQTIADGKRIEYEKQISAKEYLKLSLEADTSLHQIIKQRYCFIYQNQYFELDTYPFSNTYAILEIELTGETREIVIPDFIKVIKDVTSDEYYKNYNLAKVPCL